jgi:hypothetical protein
LADEFPPRLVGADARIKYGNILTRVLRCALEVDVVFGHECVYRHELLSPYVSLNSLSALNEGFSPRFLQ